MEQVRNNIRLKFWTRINIVLISVIMLLVVIILMDMFRANYDIPEFNINLSAQDEIYPISGDFDVDVDDYYVYIAPDAKEDDKTLSKEELTKGLDIVGIITGENNQAIIEDKINKETFFLYKGDSFRGWTVFGINENGLILEYKGERVELKR